MNHHYYCYYRANNQELKMMVNNCSPTYSNDCRRCFVMHSKNADMFVAKYKGNCYLSPVMYLTKVEIIFEWKGMKI
jgi:hypothetical protein